MNEAIDQPGTARIEELGGKYRILAELGQGGTANVSLAVARGPQGFSKLVVLKVMKRALMQEPEFSGMFMDEARLAARLNHINIVQTNEVFEYQGLPVIVMEYLEGQTLSGILAKDRKAETFSQQMHLRVISEILGGLQYSHELTDFDGKLLNVVHRDVSPHNVFVTYDGQCKLLDFGIAKLEGSNVETATGVIKGKLRYMPPEQVTADGVDARSDVFAAGVMLWEAMTGVKMWAKMSEAEIINRLINAEIPPPSSVCDSVPKEMEEIIAKAMAPDQDDRYPSARALQQDLDGYLSHFDSTLKSREIGAAVSSMFAEERAKTKALVDSQLKKVATLSADEYAQSQPLELTSFTHTGTGATNLTPHSQTIDTRQRSTNLALYALLGLVSLAVGFLLWKVNQKPEQPPIADPRPEPAKVDTVPDVIVRVTAFPAQAKLYLDDKLLAGNPASIRRKQEEAVHQLRAEAEGHVLQTREITFREDAEIVLSLSREATTETEEKDEKPQPKARPAYRPSPGPKAAPKANCTPPYVVDSNGVKRYKPECF